jgi:AcrR family transcriptional regulator
MERKSERLSRQGDASREAILDAALEIAADLGYDGTTVSAVTARSGLPASSIYWHFGSKDELLAAALEHSYREWRRNAPMWRVRRQAGADPEERIESWFQRAVKHLTRNPHFWRLGLMLTLEQRVEEPKARRLFLQVRQNSEDALHEWWRDVLADRPTTEEELRRLARFHMMMMDGMFIQFRATSTRIPPRQVTLLARALAAHVAKPVPVRG